MEWIVGAIMIAIVVYPIWQGYQRETKPTMELRDNGQGFKEPVCKKCEVKLVTVSRETSSGLADLLAMAIGFIGLVLFLWNIVAGIIVLIFAALVHVIGKGKRTALTCPVCGQDASILD